MIRFLFTLFVMIPVFVWATEPEKVGCASDSAATDSTMGRIDMGDDTLVFDDWEKRDPTYVQQGSMDPSEGYQRLEMLKPDHVVYSDEAYPISSAAPEPRLNSLRIYPNPSADWLHIAYGQSPVSMYIVGMDGRSIPLSIDQEIVDIRSYVKGTYVLRLVYADRVDSIKFVKN